MARIRRHRRDTVQSPLETYLREINEMALLTADEEKELAVRIAHGDKLARDRMVRANLRLVVNIARGYVGKGLALQDLIEEGNLGLLRAVQGFDPAVGTRFSTYASYWIKQSIKRALVNTAKPIRIPAYMVELLFKWRKTAAELHETQGRPASVEEIAKALKIPKKKLAIVKKAIKVYNLVPQTDQPENGWSLGEMLMDERTRTPDVVMVEADNLRLVLDRLDEMDKREATVLRHALRAQRRRAQDAQGDRRVAWPDARARPPDRKRSPRQTVGFDEGRLRTAGLEVHLRGGAGPSASSPVAFASLALARARIGSYFRRPRGEPARLQLPRAAAAGGWPCAGGCGIPRRRRQTPGA